MNKTVLFTYDGNGNITERCEYGYTSKTGEELTELACTHYGYAYDGDKLISYNGESVTYNALGNPTVYRGKTLEWQYGNRLTKYGTTTFAYDGAGRRVSKGSIFFTYDSDGRLIKQSDGLEFIYDNSGVAGVIYNGATYLYRKDAQGNIIALLDSNGNVVVEYKYDAWGNHEAEVADENYATLANLNPYRYRGYYFDEETGLYFLQTRYYDPETGRFISRDSIGYADPEVINGLNLYAYCGNNPVMNIDPTGNAWWDWLLGGLTLLAGVALCFVPGGQVFGVGLIVGGTSSLLSSTLNAVGVDGKISSIITSGLSIIAGIALCFTPFAGIGAGLIGQGVGGIAGGFISEAFGGSFTTGAAIGGFIGNIIGGFAYRGITNYRLSKMTPYQKGVMGERYVKALYGRKVYKPTTDMHPKSWTDFRRRISVRPSVFSL